MKKKSQGDKSGEKGACESRGMPETPKLTTLCMRGVVVMELEGSNLLQFPFEPASPSFSDVPGYLRNIFDSL
jgi:hypothetical protein